MKKYSILLTVFIVIISCDNKHEKLELSPLFTDSMVLQRNEIINIWGKSSQNAEINIDTEWGEKLKLKSDSKGNWNGKLLTPEAGGPFTIEISSVNENINIKDILIGEVWLASGQSNMEMSLMGFPPDELILNSKNEILNANYPNIQMFTVERSMSLKPSKKLKGSWVKTSPNEVKKFSATAYFFAQELFDNLDIPIGIIHSSWGGTPAEAWTSETKLKDLGLFNETLESMSKNNPKGILDLWFNKFDFIEIPQERYSLGGLKDYYENLKFSDDGLSESELNDDHWQDVMLPGKFDTLKLNQFDGVIWLRKDVHIDNVNSDYYLNIGYIDDMDKTFINGNYIGGLSGYGYAHKKRLYRVPKSYLKQGKNTIAIRAIDTGGPGRFKGRMYLSNDIGEIISIRGSWKYHPVAEIYENKFYIYGTETQIENRPHIVRLNPLLPQVLFNSMINPVLPYTIKGVIWYQGEGNVGRHDQYSSLFPGMIEDWRSRWNNEFPFYFVQIAPFKYTEDPLKDVSQKLREAQRKTLKIPKTGMVVTLDIGDFNNIHPANKKEVGKRLARIALVNDYNSTLSPYGPILKNSEIFKSAIKINFTNVGSGLINLDDELSQFEISDSSMKFFKANVSVENNSIFVSSPFVKNPIYARYAWSDTPNATLFNSDNFPASSFEIEVK